MIILYAEKNQLHVQKTEPVTSGSVNVYPVRFGFSADWDGLARTAVFKAGTESRSVHPGESGECAVPWEVLVKPNLHLLAGVCGTRGGEVVLPTIWADLGTILEGATTGNDAKPPTPDLWEQELATKGDALAYDGLNLSLMSGEKTLSTVAVISGGGDGGITDHRLLTGRDAENQHPINAVTGLEEALASIPIPMTADQLRKILNGV